MSSITGEGGSSAITGEGGGALLGEGPADVTGTGSGTLTKVTGAASGTVGDAATAAGTLTRITGSASGTFGVTGTAAGTLVVVTGAASGTVDAGGGETPPGEDEDHSQDSVPRIGGSGPKHVSGKPLGWRARRKKALEEQSRAAELAQAVTGSAAGRLGGLSGRAAGTVGVTGQGQGSIGLIGSAEGFTFDAVGFDNDWLQLVA